MLPVFGSKTMMNQIFKFYAYRKMSLKKTLMPRLRVHHAGFTLIELMIVVAIIGILATIAYPSYQDSVKKSRRADAKSALMGFVNAMERYYTENNTYCDAAATGETAVTGCGTSTPDTGKPAIFADEAPLDGTTKYYDLTIQAVSQTTYTLRATPKGAQNGDGMLEIKNTESRGRWDRNNDGDVADTGEDTWD